MKSWLQPATRHAAAHPCLKKRDRDDDPAWTLNTTFLKEIQILTVVDG
jgi:hypothetical protein